jgi:hypothetical protein
VGAWIALRPAPQGGNYSQVMDTIAEILKHDPGRLVALSSDYLFSGWIASFNAQSDVFWLAKAVFALVGLLGIAGAVMRAAGNHLDGWYVLLYLAMLFLWLFPEDNMRRLLYPVVPLLLIQAGNFVLAAVRRLGLQDHSTRIVLGVAVLPLALCAPAFYLVHSKSLDTTPLVPGFAHSYADMTDYYTTIQLRSARVAAARHIAVLSGLEGIARVTPPGSKVMWMRPDYVALLGQRHGVPWYYRDGLAGLAREARRSKVDFIVLSTLYKVDMDGRQLDPFDSYEALSAFASPVSYVRNAELGNYEFVLMRIDSAALERFLATLP